MKIFKFLCVAATLLFAACGNTETVLLEAESFTNKGGWVVDQQSMDVLGSPYLLAHGAGKPIEDAETGTVLPESGRWHVWVRTFNWTSPWSEKEGPGAFKVEVNGKELKNVCGTKGDSWMWQYAGSFKAKGTEVEIELEDLTGFDGRCDAIVLSKKKNVNLPASAEEMHALRLLHNPAYDSAEDKGQYDFIVVGGGISGICAAVAASRLGMKTAILNDRPVLGGNNSAEIRVHLGGMIELKPYPNLGNLIKEFGHKSCKNADDAEKYQDWKKEQILKDAGVDIFAPYHAESVCKDGTAIKSVNARHIETGRLISLSAPLFADCTGDGNLGFMAGADWREGREARSEYGEPMVPETADNLHLGASLLWNSRKTDSPSAFPEFDYGLKFNDSTVQKVTRSEWYWETGLNDDMIKDVEKIRDFGLLAIYSNWSYLKNRSDVKEEYADRTLDWVAYITGKRESRRLLGPHVLKENDIVGAVPYPDGTCSTSWSIDLHYYREQNSKDFPGREFLTVADHKYFDPYPIPYRCLYSRNVSNLFMAGRDISATHVAMGSIRVIRTCGMMGEVVGMAAAVCKRNGCLPGDVYPAHFPELQGHMRDGVGQRGLPNDQNFCIHGCFPPTK